MSTRRTRTVALLALVGALSLSVATGAATFSPAAPTDDLAAGVVLQPSSPYAYLSGGETVIDLTGGNPALEARGLNPDARVTFEDVAVLHYEGPRYAEIWVTHDGGGLRLSANGHPIESRAHAVNLSTGESVGLDLRVNTSDAAAVQAISTLSVHARVAESAEGAGGGGGPFAAAIEEAPTWSVTAREGVRIVEVRNANGGEPIDVQFASPLALSEAGIALDRVRATPADAGDLTVRVAARTLAGTPAVGAVRSDVGLTPVAAVRIEGDGGDLTGVAFGGTLPPGALPAEANRSGMRVLRLVDGEWVVVSDGPAAEGFRATAGGPGTFVIAAPVPNLTVANVSLATVQVPNGTRLSMTATVRNRGTGAGSIAVPFVVGDRTVATRTPAVPAGATATVAVQTTVNATANRTVRIGGRVAGTLVGQSGSASDTAVQSPGPTTTTPTGPTTPPPTTAPPTTSAPVEEQAAIPLRRIGGLLTLAGLAAGIVFLVRRVSV